MIISARSEHKLSDTLMVIHICAFYLSSRFRFWVNFNVQDLLFLRMHISVGSVNMCFNVLISPGSGFLSAGDRAEYMNK